MTTINAHTDADVVNQSLHKSDCFIIMRWMKLFLADNKGMLDVGLTLVSKVFGLHPVAKHKETQELKGIDFEKGHLALDYLFGESVDGLSHQMNEELEMRVSLIPHEVQMTIEDLLKNKGNWPREREPQKSEVQLGLPILNFPSLDHTRVSLVI